MFILIFCYNFNNTKNMGRNYYDACHENCPENNGQPVYFRILTGALPICPKCFQTLSIENEPTIRINRENEQRGIPPLEITSSNSVERR